MGRAPCCDKSNVKRGPWSPDEDTALKNYIQKHGTSGNWISLPHKAGLNRCGKSCRLRWLNYLRPDIKHGGFTEEEDNIICTLYKTIGSRWSVIASQLPGRTDNDVKNHWNTKLKKKLLGGSNKNVTAKDHLQLSSSSLLTKPEIDNHGFSTFPLSKNVVFEQNIESQRLGSDPIHFPLQEFMEEPEFGTNVSNNYIVSSPREVSSVSVPYSLDLENNYASWSGNGDSENYGFFMDFGFGSLFDLY